MSMFSTGQMVHTDVSDNANTNMIKTRTVFGKEGSGFIRNTSRDTFLLFVCTEFVFKIISCGLAKDKL